MPFSIHFKNKISAKKRAYFLLEIFLFSFFMWFYALHSQLLPELSKPYSNSIAYRLQTNAFLQGKLAISPRPFGIPFDFIYTRNGMQQPWGLGVPILRLPFEWAARECGFYYFPDRLITLFYVGTMVLFINIALRLMLYTLGLTPYNLAGFVFKWLSIAWILLYGAMNELTKNHFKNYGEPVFYGCAFSYVLLALFWIYIQRPSNQNFFVICLLSGLIWLIRPTFIFYGLVTAAMVISLTFYHTRNLMLISKGALCFALGIFLNLIFNYFRFGSALEFGYSANLSGPTMDYMLRFDSPFGYESVLRAAKELISALFFNHRFESDLHFRWRQYYFSAFSSYYLLLLGGGIIFILTFHFTKRFLISIKIPDSCIKIIYLSFIWGTASFFLFFIFYLRTPVITSRYLSEFCVGLHALLLAGVVLGLSIIRFRHPLFQKKSLQYLFLFLLITFIYLNNKNYCKYSPSESNINSEKAVQMVRSFNQEILTNLRLPETFYCGKSYSIPGLRYQFSNWGTPDNCLVSDTTTVFLPAKKCLSFNYSVMHDHYLPKIRAKRDIEFLKLKNSAVSQDNSENSQKRSFTECFCSKETPPNTISLYTIGWVRAGAIKSMDEKLPIILNWVRVSD